MAIYHDIDINPAPFKADADLSAACAVYRFVTNASTPGSVKLANGASNPAVLGVLQNSPSQNSEASVRVLGFSKLTGRNGTCNLRPGTFIICGSDGVAEAQAVPPGSPVCGRWMGPIVTTGSVIGEALLFGFTGCSVSAS